MGSPSWPITLPLSLGSMNERKSSSLPVMGQKPNDSLHQRITKSPSPASLTQIRCLRWPPPRLAHVAFLSTSVLPFTASLISSSSSSPKYNSRGILLTNLTQHQISRRTSALTKIWTAAHSCFAVAIFALPSLDLFPLSSLPSLRLARDVHSMVLVVSVGVSWAITL